MLLPLGRRQCLSSLPRLDVLRRRARPWASTLLGGLAQRRRVRRTYSRSASLEHLLSSVAVSLWMATKPLDSSSRQARIDSACCDAMEARLDDG